MSANMAINHGSLFSGIGGFDLASEWCGWNNSFHCEWNDFGKKILKHYWPNAKSYGDITQTDFTIWRGRIDVLSGGFPCQPYSVAGKRQGKEDERHLWPEMLRAIREIQPAYVVGENVHGLVNWNGGLVFDEVQADLEAEGYEVIPVILPAVSVDAPHKRDRVWFIAYSSDARAESMQHGREYGIYRTGDAAYSASEGLGRKVRGSTERQRFAINSIKNDAAYSNGIGRLWRGIFTGSDFKEEQSIYKDIKCDWNGIWRETPRCCADVAYTNGQRLTRKKYWEAQPERFAKNGLPGNWENFPTQSPICSGNDGISDRLDGITFPKWRNESIKVYGNAIVPQVAYEIFKVINQHIQLCKTQTSSPE